MKKPAVNHHKAHKSPQWRSGAWSPRAGAPPSASRRRGPAGAARRARPVPSRRRPGGRVPVLRSRGPNWTLRRYIRASPPRVWLRRQAPEAGGPSVPAGPVVVGPVVARTAPPGERARGVSLSSGHALRYGVHRNRQMEHFTQVAEGLRGGVRRGAAITRRERGVAPDQGLATLSDIACV